MTSGLLFAALDSMHVSVDTPAVVVKTMEEAVSIPNYLAFITIIVAVVGVLMAVFGIGSTYLSAKLSSTLREGQKKVEEAQDATVKEQAIIRAYGASIRQTAGAFFPSGHFISQHVRTLLTQEELDKCPCGETLALLEDRLSRAFLANAEFGQSVQQLYVGKRDEFIVAVGYLTQYPSSFVETILIERRDMEKEKPEKDGEVIQVLTQAILEVERALKMRTDPCPHED